MEIGNLVVKILEVVAWPITIIIILLVFKKQLSRIILRLSKLRYKDVERIKAPPTVTPVYDRLLQVAEISPRAAVTEAWMIIETATTEAAKAQGIKTIRAITGREVILELAKKARLEGGTIELYDYLRRMRNNAAHSLEFEISYEDVIRYIDLALSLAHRLRT